jgi:FkbM family methyltransferase
MSAITKAAVSLRMHFRLFGAKGVLKRALIAVSGTNNEFKAPIPHSSQEILLRLGTTDVAAFEHVFINDEYGFSLARQPSIILDAGANVGMSAVYFALRYPAATVIAIEPDPTNFAVLSKNARLFPRIAPINAALWSHEGVVRLQDGGAGNWGMRVAETSLSSGVNIRSTTLRTLLEQLAIDQIDLLKIDVEGAECEIFKDASPWISRVGVICAELHDRFRPGCSKIFEAATAGFPIKWRRGELHCVAREGLIAAEQFTNLSLVNSADT